MLRIRLREQTVEQASIGDVSVDLVSAETSVHIGQAGFGWGFSYRRPIRVESERDSVTVRDHVMVARLAGLTAAVLLAIRRFGS